MWRFGLLLFCGWLPWSMQANSGVNECADSTICPIYATCTDTPDSYYCTCKQGFLSSSGLEQFTGPGVECRDVDECSLNASQCGPNSVCENMRGRYKCSCLPGFSSSTGDNWSPGKPGHFFCEDMGACFDTTLCPEHAKCISTVGGYHCECQDGFIAIKSLCKDRDECANPRACPENTTCHNTVGNYSCVCNPGFESSTGTHGPGGTCKDISECIQDPSPCGPISVCTNALGSYSCGCTVGFRPTAPFKCQEDIIPNNEQVLKCQAGASLGAEYVPFCALMNATFSILDEACADTSTIVSLKRTAKKFTSVIEKLSNQSSLTKDEKSALGTVLLESMESTVLAAFLSPSANGSQTIRTERLDIESRVIKDECAEENMVFHVNAGGSEMKIGCSTIKESESIGTTGVALVSFASMESVLDESFFQDPQHPLAKRKLKMNSRVIAGIMTGVKKGRFSDPVIYTVENIEPKQESERPLCVSWSADVGGGRWTSSGCVVRKVSETSTECSCNQMVNLAVIMASGPLTMESSLYIISHVGMIISLVCLALAIATFLLCRAIHNHNTYLHLHLCVCLFLAKILFLTGADKTDSQTGCAIIAGFLHYLFLACFFWMLVEAVMLFLMVRNLKVVNYFSSRNVKMLHLCVFGYGIPVLVVVVAASVQPQGYGMRDRCWLNTETGFIWSFLGPVCTIIMINFILLTWTLWILKQKLSSVNAEVSTLKDSRLLTFKAFAQLFILGCSWVFGIFQIGPVANVMAYLFTVINSLQGAFIFLIHCLLNRQVREEYRRWFTRKTKPSSQSQTSRIVISSMPSTSNTG